MHNNWRGLIEKRLRDAAGDRRVWGYAGGSDGAAEPTALAAIALSTVAGADAGTQHAGRWLGQTQHADGAVPVTPGAPGPHWTTAHALLAWMDCDGPQVEFAEHAARATGWLLEQRGRPVGPSAEGVHHDTTLVGWPWVAGSHSWLEPTAMAVLALRAAGRGDHRRVAEATRLIRDRALPSGGWNYGNRQVLGSELRAFPATTGIALTALAGTPEDEAVRAAVAFLERELPRVRAPLSLGWGLLGLTAWGRRPPDGEKWLEETAQRVLTRPANPHYLALLLLAGREVNVFVDGPEVGAHV